MLELQNISYSYASQDCDSSTIDDFSVLTDCSLTLLPGEIVAVIGHNGCGKSTLGKIACGILSPTCGRVILDGKHVSQEKDSFCEQVAYVGQDPFNQIVSTSVVDEVGFGPINLGLDEKTVKQRIDACLEAVGLSDLTQRRTTDLSGGQQQRLVLAGALAMKPDYLVFDEVTSQLDSSARSSLRVLIRKLASEGAGILTITHDAQEIFSADKVVVLDGGTIQWIGTPQALIEDKYELFSNLIYQSPYTRLICDLVRLQAYQLTDGAEPQAVASWIAANQGNLDVESYGALQLSKKNCTQKSDTRADRCTGSLVAQNATFSYDDLAVVSHVSFEMRRGEVVLLAGKTGSGKSTLARMLSGLYIPDKGSTYLEGMRDASLCRSCTKPSYLRRLFSFRQQNEGCTYVAPGMVGLSFQRPEDQLFLDTVEAELQFAPQNFGLDAQKVSERVARACKLVGVNHEWLASYPMSLSGGQARRVAIASILTLDAQAYIFDEPTAGLDVAGREMLHNLVTTLAAQGYPVAIITHDVEEWLEVADRVVLLKEGHIVVNAHAAQVKQAPELFERADIMPPALLSLQQLLCSHPVEKDGECYEA